MQFLNFIGLMKICFIDFPNFSVFNFIDFGFYLCKFLISTYLGIYFMLFWLGS